jgi:hypothetical protein
LDNYEHFHPTARAAQLGPDLQPGLLTTREDLIAWPGRGALLSFSGDKTTFLERILLPNAKTFLEKTLGRGRVLFVPLLVELNDNLKAVGDLYRFALRLANVAEAYSTPLNDPGVLICPTQVDRATLCVLASKSAASEISFRDEGSGKVSAGRLEPARAALLLVSDRGELLASYNW